MKALSYFFFYTYIGLVFLAGFWGAFINPYFDFNWLFNLDAHTLTEYARTNMLSQYRFLRAIEMGFGLFSLAFVKRIFKEKTFNILFLVIMASGVLSRLVSWIVDGQPNEKMLFFIIYETVGLFIIYVYTKTKTS